MTRAGFGMCGRADTGAGAEIGRRSRWPCTRLLLIVAVCIAGLISQTAIADTQVGYQEITAQVGHAIELTVPMSYDWGTLSIGENESSLQDIIVKSTAPYDLLVRADSTKMTQYHLASGMYVAEGKELVNPLQWREVTVGAYRPIDTVDMPVVTAAPPTGNGGSVCTVVYRQVITYDDQSLPDGMVYRIVLTYTATNTV